VRQAGYNGEIIRRGDMEGKLGSTLLLHNVKGRSPTAYFSWTARNAILREFRGDPRCGAALNETGSYEAVIYLTRKGQAPRVAWRVEHAWSYEGLPFTDESQPEVRRPLLGFPVGAPTQ
jgi:leucyl aminopeptidase